MSTTTATAGSPAPESLLGAVLERVKRRGADAADAIYVENTSLSLSQRLGEPESLDRSEGYDLGLRVFVAGRQAIVSSTDITDAALDTLAERAVAMARVVPEDPEAMIAEAADLATEHPDLEQFDPNEPSADTLMELARETEAAAMAVPGVTNSEGAEASWGQGRVYLAASNGFMGGYASSRRGLGCAVLAGEGTAMERDSEGTGAVFAEDMLSPAEVGRIAGERAVRRLNPRKVETQQVPVIYDPRMARRLLSSLAGAINGTGIVRGTSFLRDYIDKQVLPSGVNVIDDPLRKRGLRSKPFDAEGLPTTRRMVVEDGILRTWILDLRTARRLGLRSTGHAGRGTSGPPSPSVTNLYFEPGTLSPKDLMADIKSGFYITGLMGQGVNGVTGDYSMGANGFWIENGEIAYPVSEVTIASNLKDMFRSLTLANDLLFRYGIDSPTVRVENMTVAGI